MSIYLSILKQGIIDPIQNSIVVPIFNHSIQALILLPIILRILNQWIIDPLQNYIIVPILDLLTAHRIKKLLLPIIGFTGKQIKNHLLKFVSKCLFECVFGPIKRRIYYLFKCDSYVQKLENQTEMLKQKRYRLQHSIAEAERNGEQIYDNVTRWLTTATNEINEAEELVQRKEECLNFKGRYHLNKEVDKKASSIDKLLNQQGLFPISYSPSLQQIVEPFVLSRLRLRFVFLSTDEATVVTMFFAQLT